MRAANIDNSRYSRRSLGSETHASIKDDADASQELAAHGSDHGVMVLALFALSLIEGLKFRIMLHGYSGGQSERMSQIGRAPFAQVYLGCLELSGLINSRVNAHIG